MGIGDLKFSPQACTKSTFPLGIFQTPAICFEPWWDQSKVGASEEELQHGIVTAQLFCQEPMTWMESFLTSLVYCENIKLPLRALVQCHRTFLRVTHTPVSYFYEKQERQKKTTPVDGDSSSSLSSSSIEWIESFINFIQEWLNIANVPYFLDFLTVYSISCRLRISWKKQPLYWMDFFSC